MSPFNFFGSNTETRSHNIENPDVPLTAESFFAYFGVGGKSFAGENVTETAALGVPAVQAAINVISGTIASLPLQLFRRTENGAEKAKDHPLYRIIHDVVNADQLTSFAWRKYSVGRYLAKGRSFTFIETNRAGDVRHLWPLNPDKVEVVQKGRRRFYHYTDADGLKVYKASEIIDLVWMPGSDGHSHVDPLYLNRNAIGLAIAAERFASSVFENGGVPPFALETSATSATARERATTQTEAHLKAGRKSGKQAIALTPGDKLVKLGSNPAETQMLELRRFQVLEIARVFNIPPTFLHDLSAGTYSNTEQLDLAFVKHTLTPLLEQFEQELNAKLFPPGSDLYVEFNLDGLMRGDSSRIANFAAGVNAGLYMPDEIRATENRPPVAGGDRAYRQGALVPLDSPAFTTPPQAPPT